MLDDTIQKIEARLRESQNLPEETRAELNALLHSLKAEVNELAKTRAPEAAAITGLADRSAHAATEAEPDGDFIRESVDGLADSVKEFEISHPQLTATVNGLCNILANIGI